VPPCPRQIELTALEPVLLVKTAETAKLLQQLAVEQAEVVRVRSRVEVEESTVKRQAEAVAELQADAQSEVEAAMPVMENAIRALDALNKNVCGVCVLHDVCELCACSLHPRALCDSRV
jgi:hypothetical protein